MATHETNPQTICPACSMGLDAATNAGGDRAPRAGDLTVCGYCAEALVFEEGLGVRIVTDADLADESPALVRNLRTVQEGIRKLVRESERKHRATPLKSSCPTCGETIEGAVVSSDTEERLRHIMFCPCCGAAVKILDPTTVRLVEGADLEDCSVDELMKFSTAANIAAKMAKSPELRKQIMERARRIVERDGGQAPC